MERIPIYDYKARLSEFGRLAKEAGKRFIVTNRGEDMFEIGPVSHERDSSCKAEAMENIERLTADAFDQAKGKYAGLNDAITIIRNLVNEKGRADGDL